MTRQEIRQRLAWLISNAGIQHVVKELANEAEFLAHGMGLSGGDDETVNMWAGIADDLHNTGDRALRYFGEYRD